MQQCQQAVSHLISHLTEQIDEFLATGTLAVLEEAAGGGNGAGAAAVANPAADMAERFLGL